MGEVFITRRDGFKETGLTEVVSVLDVTYPAGSTCTISNGSKTITAPNTNGKVLFNVDIGTWTVTATDGAKSKSQTVEITSAGQCEVIALSFRVYLIKNGVATDVLGGIGGSTSNGALVLEGAGAGTTYVGSRTSENQISRGVLDTLYIDNSTENTYSEASLTYGSVSLDIEGGTRSTKSVDISSVTSAENIVIKFRCGLSTYGNSYVYIYNLWLE